MLVLEGVDAFDVSVAFCFAVHDFKGVAASKEDDSWVLARGTHKPKPTVICCLAIPSRAEARHPLKRFAQALTGLV